MDAVVRTMKRYGSVARLRPGGYEEYKRLHANSWPGVLARLRESHIHNYSIYHHDGWLFSYFEYTGDDYEADVAKIAADETTQKWWEVCTPCLESWGPREQAQWWTDAEEVFHTD